MKRKQEGNCCAYRENHEKWNFYNRIKHKAKQIVLIIKVTSHVSKKKID